jgi:hypothetical protein
MQQPLETAMKFRYTHISVVRGLTKGAEALDCEIYADERTGVRATLAHDPDAHCLSHDRSRSVASLVLTSGFKEGEEQQFEARIGAVVEGIREERRKRAVAGTFLVVQGAGDTPDFAGRISRDCGPFSIAVDKVPKDAIRDQFSTLVPKLLAATALAFPQVVGFQPLSDDVVFYDDSGRELFGFNFTIGGIGELIISRPASTEGAIEARAFASKIVGDAELATVVRLFNESLVVEQDPLRRFLAAWTALEVFVNKNFATYSARFWGGLTSACAPAIRTRYVKRIHEVMNDKYRSKRPAKCVLTPAREAAT